MPMSKYNKYYGDKPGAAAKTLTAMQGHYGSKKGKKVFYASVNKKKARGT